MPLGIDQATLANVLVAITILALGLFIGNLARRVMTRVTREVLPISTRLILEKAVYYGIIVIAGIAALSRVGLDLSGLVIAGGIFGIIIGFAAQSVVSNLFSGMFLQFEKTIQVGDVLEIVGTDIAGLVTDITIFSTRVRSFDGTQVRVPNEKIFTSNIRRFTAHAARRVEVRVGIAYGSDVGKAIDVIVQALAAHPLVLAEPSPIVFIDNFGDSSIVLNVFAWAPVEHFFTVRQVVPRIIKESLEANGIEIPLPQRVVHLMERGFKEPGR